MREKDDTLYNNYSLCEVGGGGGGGGGQLPVADGSRKEDYGCNLKCYKALVSVGLSLRQIV